MNYQYAAASRLSAPPSIHDAIRLVPLATDPGSQMNIFGHDGDPLGMDGTQVGVLEETHEIRLCRLLQSKDRMAHGSGNAGHSACASWADTEGIPRILRNTQLFQHTSMYICVYTCICICIMPYFVVFSLIEAQNSKKQPLKLAHILQYFHSLQLKTTDFFIDVEVGIPKFEILAPPHPQKPPRSRASHRSELQGLRTTRETSCPCQFQLLSL